MAELSKIKVPINGTDKTYDLKDSTARQAADAKLPKAGGTMTGRIISDKPDVHLITGTGVVGHDDGSSASPRYFPGQWTFNTGLNPTDGDVIYIKAPTAGTVGVYVSINNGTSYHPVVINSTTRLSTQYVAEQYLQLQFEANGSATTYPINGGNTTSTVTGGVWRVVNYSNTTYSDMSQSELVTGTATYQRTVRADHLNPAIQDLITQNAWATKNTTAITATSESHANLNDYKTPGNYSSLSSSVSQYIDNAPTTSAGFNLIVVRLINRDDRIRQFAIINASSAIYTRHCSGDTWTSWVNIAQDTTYDDMSASEIIAGTATTSKTIRADYLRTAERQLAFMIDKMEAITATSSAHVDLNTYTSAGNFSANNSNSTYVDNQPRTPGTGFNLVVVKGISSSNYARQLLWYYDSDNLFVRSKSGSTASYTDWHLIAESSKPVYRPNLAITSTGANKWVKLTIPKLASTHPSIYDLSVKLTLVASNSNNYFPQSASILISSSLDNGFYKHKASAQFSNNDGYQGDKYYLDPNIYDVDLRIGDEYPNGAIYIRSLYNSYEYTVSVEEIVCDGVSATISTPDFYGTTISVVNSTDLPNNLTVVSVNPIASMNRGNGIVSIAHTNFTKPSWAGGSNRIFEVFKVESVSINSGDSSSINIQKLEDASGDIPLVLECEVWGMGGSVNYPMTITSVRDRSDIPGITISFTNNSSSSVSALGVHLKYTLITD